MDPHASLQFLNLLCRMISRRLREIKSRYDPHNIIQANHEIPPSE